MPERSGAGAGDHTVHRQLLQPGPVHAAELRAGLARARVGKAKRRAAPRCPERAAVAAQTQHASPGAPGGFSSFKGFTALIRSLAKAILSHSGAWEQAVSPQHLPLLGLSGMLRPALARSASCCWLSCKGKAESKLPGERCLLVQGGVWY